MEIGGWFLSLGLDQCERSFQDNRIDADVLPHLTADDLKDIGVSAVGDRRRPPSAIAVLPGAAPPPDRPTSKQRPVPRKKVTEVAAERRPITMMFCDLVGSTSIAAKMDAEDSRNLNLDAASEAVNGLGGHLLKTLGDGLMTLFGYPMTRERKPQLGAKGLSSWRRNRPH
jgi:class 3 adenylate cyclase